MKDNIIKFRKKSKISDSEINGLFLGLVKLIKKVALEDASNITGLEVQELNDELQKNSISLAQKDEEIEKLKKEINFLRAQLKTKSLKILHLSCMSARKLASKEA